MEALCHSLIKVSTNSCRFRINWFVIYSVTLLLGINTFIQTPSLHQFVTSSDNQTRSNIEPGLGLSETWYSLIVSMSSIGTFVGALTVGLFARHLYIKPGLIVELILNFIGGMLYAFGNNGWLILLSRFFTGTFLGLHMSLMRIYLLETSEKLIQALPPEKREKSTIKYTALFLLFIHAVLGGSLGPVIAAVAVQIPSISKFRWAGYYISIHSFLLAVLVVLVFSERWNDLSRDNAGKKKSMKEKLFKEIKSPAVPHYLSLLFIFLFFIFGWNISIIETLQNPILSDQFGLTIENTSYVFIGVTAIYFVSVVFMYSFQKLHVDNHLILICSFITAIVGTLIMLDWQSLGGDPCNQLTVPNSNESYELVASIDSSDCDYNSPERCLCEQFGNASDYECFWNPVSRITGEYCERCRPVCLSKTHTLSFVQLFVGMVLLSFCLTPGRSLVTVIASDIAGNRSQALLMGALVSTSAFSRSTGPLWGNSTYLIAGHRTWLTMSIMSAVQLIALVLIIIMYRKMKRKVPQLPLTEEDRVELMTADEEETETQL